MFPIKIELNERKCGECSACCQGHLTGTAHGIPFGPNKPCQFVGGNGCMIYSYRPYDPCITFKCEWKINKDIPDEYRPDKCKAIFMHREVKGKLWLQVAEAGRPLSADVMHFIMILFNDHKYDNVLYQRKGAWYELTR